MMNIPEHKDTPKYSESTKGAMPKKLNNRHRVLMRRLLAGHRLKDACAELGFDVARASLITKSPMFKEEMRRMREEIDEEFVECEGGKASESTIRERLKNEAPEALNTLVGLRDSASSENVKQKSALEILDRAGYKAPDKIEADVSFEATPAIAEALDMLVNMKKDGDETKK